MVALYPRLTITDATNLTARALRHRDVSPDLSEYLSLSVQRERERASLVFTFLFIGVTPLDV